MIATITTNIRPHAALHEGRRDWTDATTAVVHILLCFGMIQVSGHPTAFQGAKLLSSNDTIAQDEPILRTAAQVGKRFRDVVLRRASTAHAW